MFVLQSLISCLLMVRDFLSIASWSFRTSHPLSTYQEQERLQLYSPDFSTVNVSLPVDNPTRSFWTQGDANPLATAGSRGPLSDSVDIAIIGSGMTGISAAYHLSQSLRLFDFPVKIAVFEARNFCSGATGRNGGHLAPIIFQGFHQNELKYGNAEAVRFLALENHTVHALLSFIQGEKIGDDIDLTNGSRVKFLLSDKEKAELHFDFIAADASHTVDLSSVRFLSNQETHLIYGPDYPSVQYFAHNLWPLKFVTKLFLTARKIIKSMRNGSELILHTHTPVLGVIPINSGHKNTLLPKRWRLRTSRGDIDTSIVIHATNAYSGFLLPFLAPGASNRSITPVRGQIIATRASVSAGHFKKGSFDANDGFEYWFSRPVKQNMVDQPLVILGGGRESADPGYEVGVADDSMVNPTVSERLRQFLPGLYPKGWFPENKKPEMEWTGIMGFTEASLPMVGPALNYTDGTLLKGQYIAAGYTGHGMPRAYGCAEALVEMIVADIQRQHWNAPSWFPRHYLTTFFE